MVSASNNLLDCAQILQNGGIVVHATEGVFGFACSIEHEDALERITELKGRDSQASPFLILASDLEQVATLVSLEVPLIGEIKHSWPGATTWVFPDKTKTYPYLGGADGSLAVRLTAHTQARSLIEQVGPIVSTSANRHGDAPALTVAAAQQYFGDQVDYYLPGALITPGQPSKIRHASSGEWLR